MATLQLMASHEFLEAFDRAMMPEQNAVKGELQDMARRHAAAPSRVWATYKRFEGFEQAARGNGLECVAELKVGASVRVLAGVSRSSVFLLSMGRHDIERRWDGVPNKIRWVASRKNGAKPANGILEDGSSNPFIVLSQCEGWSSYYPGEDTAAWVEFLDAEQYQVVTSVIDGIENHIVSGRNRNARWLILGGPGTGKTVVLLKILQKLLGEKLNVGFSCSDAVHHYLESATGCVIPRLDREAVYDVLLFDDPWRLRELHNPPPRVLGQGPRALVYAFDPLQLSEMPTSSDLSRVEERSQTYVLSTCYRQRARLAQDVGRMTDVLARSCPYFAKEKKTEFEANYRDLFNRFNSLEYPYPLGERKVYDHASIRTLKSRLSELQEKPGLWTHSPPILLVIDRQLESELGAFAAAEGRRNKAKITWSHQVDGIKGVDFQHVVIALARATLDAVTESFTGSGRDQYNQRRLLRIPFSRARDSLSLVIWDTNPRADEAYERGGSKPLDVSEFLKHLDT